MKNIKNTLLRCAPDIFSKFPVLFAYLYGSYATGLAHRFSDLDIGIYVEKMSLRHYLGLELSLALAIDEKLGSKVASDVRIMNVLPLVVTGTIITEGMLLFSKNEIMRVDFEASVRSAYFDFLPVLREYRTTYVENIIST